MDTVDVVLPCLDEALALPAVLNALPPGYRAIVVDNGSSDGSPEVAAAHGATVISESRRGYGAAVPSSPPTPPEASPLRLAAPLRLVPETFSS